jgi:hypothetical protein
MWTAATRSRVRHAEPTRQKTGSADPQWILPRNWRRSEEWDADNKQLTKEFVRRWEQYERTAGDNHKPLTKQERWALGAARGHDATGNRCLPRERALPDRRSGGSATPTRSSISGRAKTQPRQPK